MSIFLSYHSLLISFHLYASPSFKLLLLMQFTLTPQEELFKPHSLTQLAYLGVLKGDASISMRNSKANFIIVLAYTCIFNIVDVQEIMGKWNKKASWIFFLEIMWIKILSIGQFYSNFIMAFFKYTENLKSITPLTSHYNHFPPPKI